MPTGDACGIAADYSATSLLSFPSSFTESKAIGRGLVVGNDARNHFLLKNGATMNITRTAFYELLSSMNAGTPVGIVTLTEPKMRKTGNPYAGNCQRLAKRNGFIGCEYESCANNAMERAGLPRDFTAGPLPWGERDGRYFIAHKEDSPIPWRTVRLDHLVTCNVAGEQYTLTY
jgi:hypothetical protein